MFSTELWTMLFIIKQSFRWHLSCYCLTKCQITNCNLTLLCLWSRCVWAFFFVQCFWQKVFKDTHEFLSQFKIPIHAPWPWQLLLSKGCKCDDCLSCPSATSVIIVSFLETCYPSQLALISSGAQESWRALSWPFQTENNFTSGFAFYQHGLSIRR